MLNLFFIIVTKGVNKDTTFCVDYSKYLTFLPVLFMRIKYFVFANVNVSILNETFCCSNLISIFTQGSFNKVTHFCDLGCMFTVFLTTFCCGYPRYFYQGGFNKILILLLHKFVVKNKVLPESSCQYHTGHVWLRLTKCSFARVMETSDFGGFC